MAELTPECQEDFADVRLALGIVQHDLTTQSKITDKLAEAIEKIEEVNVNLLKMIAVHEEKHENTAEDIRELEHRLDYSSKTQTTTTTTTTGTEDEAKKTLDQLNKWKYMIIGGALVIGWILAHIKWPVLLTLFGG